MEINTSGLLDQFKESLIEFGPNLIGAVIVWIIGSILIKKLIVIFDRVLEKQKTDKSLIPFLNSLIRILLKVLLAISILSMLGVAMTSFIAILGAAGLAIGMALSGTLQNFAGGVMILLFKPFQIDDFIEAQGHKGTVKEIQIFNTILTDLDNKTIIIPNGGLSTNAIINYSTEPLRRVDVSVGIDYNENVANSRKVLMELIKIDKRILSDPAPFVGVSELGDSSVNLTVRVWVKNENYWAVFFDMNENVFEGFNKSGVKIPFPQMDVHMQKG